ncbi:MAG: hypothetical protein JO080_13115 [Mucilaginibacter sp.]|nr:hypothetical protein [Mucilaginibacter sp.]
MLSPKILTLICLLTAIKAPAQINIILKGDTLILPNGAKFWKGEEVTLGNGSMPDGSFLYIYAPEMLRIMKKKPLGSIFSSRKAIIKKFQKDGEYKQGYSYNIIVLNFGDIRNYWCDVLAAVESKELVNVYHSSEPTVNHPATETRKTEKHTKKKNNKPAVF